MSDDSTLNGKVARDLEVEEDLHFQRLQWRFQHIAWCVMVLIIVLALFGTFGPGPLSSATVADGTNVLAVEYNRFEQTDSRTELHVRVAGGQAANGKVLLWIDRAYLANVEVDEISPPPISVEQKGPRQIYSFAADAAERFEATIRLQHASWGRTTGVIGLTGGPDVRFTQTVYP